MKTCGLSISTLRVGRAPWLPRSLAPIAKLLEAPGRRTELGPPTRLAVAGGAIVAILVSAVVAEPPAKAPNGTAPRAAHFARKLVEFYDAMTVPHAFEVRVGAALQMHQDALRRRVLKDISLLPLPERLDLDVHKSEPIDHPWCTIERVDFQLWPNVYAQALLYMPKTFQDKPAPAVLCPHGHWGFGYAHADVQQRCLVLAKMGYVVLCTRQNHKEDLPYGLAHQTTMVWTNMRGIDLLESLPEVDRGRIGAAGASGGGLQTQMIAALDPRVKAAVPVGFTCDFREIMFPHRTHCGCNHFPNFLHYTDFPEIASLAFPHAIEFLTMNDWTGHFLHDNFPTLVELYRRNGYADRTTCTYWPTGHVYDRCKRERTYWWMEKWLRQDGSADARIPTEPEPIQTVFPPDVLFNWPVDNPRNAGFDQLVEHFRARYGFTRPEIRTAAEWTTYRQEMAAVLERLFGLDNALAPMAKTEILTPTTQHDVLVTSGLIASEGPLRLPVKILRPRRSQGPHPVTIALSKGGSAVDNADFDRYTEFAAAGHVVILPDVRFSGVYYLPDLAGVIHPDMVSFRVASRLGPCDDPEEQRRQLLSAWERNSICWGYPLVGMTVTDIRAVLRFVDGQEYADAARVHIETRDLGQLALAAVCAAVADTRIEKLSIDLQESQYQDGQPFCEMPNKLPVVPFIMRYGDVPQWIALLADRQVTVRNFAKPQSEGPWLQGVFTAAGNPGGLTLISGQAAIATDRPLID